MSLRLAIKRSLEPEPSDEPPATLSPDTKSNRKPTFVPPVVLPTIDKCIRNNDPSKIDTFGFVEVSGVLSKGLIEQLHQEGVEKVARHQESVDAETFASPKRKKQQQSEENMEVEEISNALQIEVSGDLTAKIEEGVQASSRCKQTMQSVYGKKGKQSDQESNYNGFVVETPKILATPPGSYPQLPHADDHCSSCIICLIHLFDKQQPTRVATYDPTNDYPTGITVQCDNCNRQEMLPDCDYRRGVHLTNEKWTCNCDKPHVQYDFEGKLCSTFGVLVDEGAADLCDSYAGKKSPKAGDGALFLPTLIHRGPGNATGSEVRYMLFFSLRPLYKNTKGTNVNYHKYNPALQIHAACVLMNQFNRAKLIYKGSGSSLEHYLGPLMGRENESLMNSNYKLKEENEKLKQQLLAKNAAESGGLVQQATKAQQADNVVTDSTMNVYLKDEKEMAGSKCVEFAMSETPTTWQCHNCHNFVTTKKRCPRCKGWKGGHRL